ncbi:MAG: sugar transferase [Vicinamibacterales bacterium]
MSGTWARQFRAGVLLATAEFCLVCSGVIATSYIRLGASLSNQGGAPYVYRVATIAAVWQLCLYYADLYERRTLLDRQLTLVRVLQALFATIIALAFVYFWFPELAIGRVAMLLTLCVLPCLAFGARLLLDRWDHARPTQPERLLIVGTSPDSVTLARELYGHRDELGLEFVGFVDRDPARVGTPLFNPAIVGTIDRLSDTIRERAADRVAISALSPLDDVPVDELLRLRFSGVPFDHLAAVYEEYTGKLAVGALTPMSLLASTGFRQYSLLDALKRGVDLLLASTGLLLVSPVLLLAAALIKLESPGPVLYRQQRVGRGGRLFTILKFRSMRADAEQSSGPVWAAENDCRITRIGRVLRRSRFDEVPQLLNVLRGEMSVVGPRPERPEIDEKLLRDIPLYAQRRLVKPGITGWAQVRHRYAADLDDVRVKLQYDLFYVKHMSLALDFLIVLMTTKTILRGIGAR